MFWGFERKHKKKAQILFGLFLKFPYVRIVIKININVTKIFTFKQYKIIDNNFNKQLLFIIFLEIFLFSYSFV